VDAGVDDPRCCAPLVIEPKLALGLRESGPPAALCAPIARPATARPTMPAADHDRSRRILSIARRSPCAPSAQVTSHTVEAQVTPLRSVRALTVGVKALRNSLQGLLAADYCCPYGGGA